MFTLYYAPGSASMIVHWMLVELGVPYELRKVDTDAREQKSPEYLRLNPAGVVPTLVFDGQPICEAAGITLHLADLHAHAGLAPPSGTPERAQYYQWMFFMANTLQPAYRAWFYPTEPAGEEHADAAKEHARLRTPGPSPAPWRPTPPAGRTSSASRVPTPRRTRSWPSTPAERRAGRSMGSPPCTSTTPR